MVKTQKTKQQKLEERIAELEAQLKEEKKGKNTIKITDAKYKKELKKSVDKHKVADPYDDMGRIAIYRKIKASGTDMRKLHIIYPKGTRNE